MAAVDAFDSVGVSRRQSESFAHRGPCGAGRAVLRHLQRQKNAQRRYENVLFGFTIDDVPQQSKTEVFLRGHRSVSALDGLFRHGILS